MRIFILAALTLLAAACTHNVTPAPAASAPVYMTFEDKVPGRYALIVEASKMQSVVQAQGFSCQSQSYPIDSREAFRSAALATLQQAVEQVELVEGPPGAGFDGVITVQVEDYSVNLLSVSGAWVAQLTADADISSVLTVEKGVDRVVARSFTVSKDRSNSAGIGCGGGAEAVAGATSAAVSAVLQQIAEEVARTPELRQP